MNMEFEHGMFGGKFMYTIEANDGKSVLCWDMVNDDKRVLSLEHVSVKPLPALENISADCLHGRESVIMFGFRPCGMFWSRC